MDQHLYQELKEAYAKTQKELKLKTTFEEAESICFLSDMIGRDGYVSEHFSRALCHRLIDLFRSWSGYFNALLIPNPADMVLLEQTKMLTEEEKQKLVLLMTKIAELDARNQYVGLSKDKIGEGKFIDDSVAFWNTKLRPTAEHIVKRFSAEWQRLVEMKEEERKQE